jgi:hypothetical protein
MEKCPFCGTELPFDARFCGRCGRMQHTTSAIGKTVIEQQTQFSQRPGEEDQDERRRRAMLPDFVLPIGPVGVGQPSAGPVPLVQGTPQVSSVPLVQGTPSLPGGTSPPQGFVHGEAPSAPSSFSSSQAPSPVPTHAGQQVPLTTCTLNRPHVDQQLTGSYTNQHVFSGTISYPEVPRSAYTCDNPNSYFFFYAEHGTWTGQIA